MIDENIIFRYKLHEPKPKGVYTEILNYCRASEKLDVRWGGPTTP